MQSASYLGPTARTLLANWLQATTASGLTAKGIPCRLARKLYRSGITHPSKFIQRTKVISEIILQASHPPSFPPGREIFLRRIGRLPVAALAGVVLLLWSGPDAAAAELFSSRSLAPDATWLATRGAGAAAGEGLSNSMGNPAALSGLRRSGVAVSHLAWAGNLSRDWVAMGAPLGSRIHLGLDASLLHGSSLEGYDALGRATGSFSASEWNFSPQISYDVRAGLAMGVGVRYFRLEDPTDPVDGFGVSAGVRWSHNDRSFGASLTDWGGSQTTPAGNFDLPSRWRVGMTQSLGSVASISVSALGTVDDSRILASAYYHLVPSLSLIGGVESGRGIDGTALGWSTGLAADHGGIIASYAFSDSPALGAIHQFGIEIPFRRDQSNWKTPTRR